MTTIDKHEVKAAAENQWAEILSSVCGIDPLYLDGVHHDCPKCGGQDRFRFIDPAAGACLCNQCFDKKNGDGLAAVQHFCDCDFPSALRLVAEHLGITPTNGKPDVDVVETVCRQKRIPVDAFRQFGAAPAQRGNLTVARLPVYNEQGEPHSHFDLALDNGKGLFKKGKGCSGMFFPGRLPQAGEMWLLAEGPKDAAALVGLGFSAAGMPTKELATKYARLFRNVHVVIVPDRDAPGEDGAQKTAGRLCRVAASVRVATLPAEFRETKGDDVRDVLARQDGEQLLRRAIEDARPWESQATASGEPISNATIEVDEEENRHAVPLSMGDVLKQVSQRTDGWPRRVDSALFVHEGEQITWLQNVASLYGWLSSVSSVRWHKGTGCISKAEVFERLRQTATKYLSVENFPHEPPLAGHYYACEQLPAGNGDTLRRLLERFAPETDIDRDLIQAMLMTTCWGGRGGERPAFVITSDFGRGIGKTTLGEAVAQIVGGCIAFSTKDDIGEMKARLLSPDALTCRVAMLDNVKTTKFSWGELESLITAPAISGKRMYVGEANRPNTITWIITLNGASLSTDMAQRSVIVRLAKPARSASWLTDTRRFIEDNRRALLADIVGALRAERHEPAQFSRWATWEREVLSRLPDPSEAQAVILERQAAVDADCEEADEIEDAFSTRLARLQYDPAGDVVKIPSGTAAQWFNEAMNDHQRTQSVSRTLRQLHSEGRLRRIIPDASRSQGGRGFLWVGIDANPSDNKFLDLQERIEEAKR